MANVTIAVIGCGNLARRDDGLGPEVVRALAGRIGADPRIRLLDAATDGMAVMFAARGCSTLLLVDACRSGAPPGAVFEVPGHELERDARPSLTLHDFRWQNALFAGRRMYGEAFPRRVVVLLVEAASVGYGVGLSQAAAAAVPRVVERIVTLVDAHLREESTCNQPST